MNLSQWPSAAEVNETLAAHGVSGVTQARGETAVEVAVSTLETISGFKPFLAGAAKTLYLTPQGIASLELPIVLASIESVTLAGVAIPPEEWFDGPDLSPPFRRLTFAKRISGSRRSLVVVGRPGYAVILPADVWEAVRNYAAATVLEESFAAQSHSVEKDQIRQENVTYRFIRPKDRVNPALRLRAEAIRVFEAHSARGMGGGSWR